MSTLRLFIIVFSNLCVLLSTTAQSTPEEKPSVRIVDMTDKQMEDVLISALNASRQGIVVVLLRGADQDLIDETTDQLNALVHQGYQRIGLILASLRPGEVGPVIGIISDGAPYAVVEEGENNTEIMWGLHKRVKQAYTDHVIPKLKAAENSGG